MSTYFSSPLHPRIILIFYAFSLILIGPWDANFQQDKVKVPRKRIMTSYVLRKEIWYLKIYLINIGGNEDLMVLRPWEAIRRRLAMPLFSCLPRADRILGLIVFIVKLSQRKNPTYIYFHLHSGRSINHLCFPHYYIIIII